VGQPEGISLVGSRWRQDDISAYRIPTSSKIAAPKLLFVTVEDGRNALAHELPDERIPSRPGVYLQTVVSRKVVVTKERSQHADILRGSVAKV